MYRFPFSVAYKVSNWHYLPVVKEHVTEPLASITVGQSWYVSGWPLT
jgi:hypothetical protein